MTIFESYLLYVFYFSLLTNKFANAFFFFCVGGGNIHFIAKLNPQKLSKAILRTENSKNRRCMERTRPSLLLCLVCISRHWIR